MTHRFHGDRTQTRSGGRYDTRHQQARKAAARTHRDTDPCARCSLPLGPMSRDLHYDHDETGGYLGFSHSRCNLRAGAVKGNQRQAQALGYRPHAQPHRTPASYPIHHHGMSE